MVRDEIGAWAEPLTAHIQVIGNNIDWNTEAPIRRRKDNEKGEDGGERARAREKMNAQNERGHATTEQRWNHITTIANMMATWQRNTFWREKEKKNYENKLYLVNVCLYHGCLCVWSLFGACSSLSRFEYPSKSLQSFYWNEILSNQFIIECSSLACSPC